ncbi:PEP-CTERM/exosortase system-associated acyltransferase [Azohydromonas caseinilytica]|uniref:PEP-CTERM/exosortase system-associated acyltransferase n=1 Tax=Azohydromonas caseinilytica TaxID=2728836 RepID=A0A848F538_9BURK|nr:PEP-CTERM/exosortase system-associated acyltransferase [Azohydromonas caseinilytica]NML13756.1 PEP-CTERM/exosortase system-associated acyltransferase [Azohydromonas caseinilytica]
MENNTLIDRFTRHFDLLPARDAASRREVLRLRHAVYCEELGYEPVTPSGLEQDEFDAHSSFALLRHRASGRTAGCVRLIRHPGHEGWRFPFERACGERLHPDYMDPAHRAGASEVSRLAVHQDFRRRRGEHDTPVGSGAPVSDISDRQYPLIAMGLFLAATALILNHGSEQSFVMVEPRLSRLLGSCGLNYTPVGELVEHHGLRGPYRTQRAEMLQYLRPESRALLEHLRDVLR